MNILLWILQIVLALWNVIGGSYSAFNYEKIRGDWTNGLPAAAWIALAVLQVLFALALVLPGAFRVLPKLTPVAAIYLTANALLGCALFTNYTGFPGILWGVVPAILVAFVAYGRIVLKPF